MTEEKKKLIEESIHSGPSVTQEMKIQYLNRVMKHHAVVSQRQFDLGRITTLEYEIHLKNKMPVLFKQFLIQYAHWDEVEKHVNEWLKMGVIGPTHSPYNSPIFATKKNSRSICLAEDFRALNANSHFDKYSMRDVSVCIGDTGQAGS